MWVLVSALKAGNEGRRVARGDRGTSPMTEPDVALPRVEAVLGPAVDCRDGC
jgi:hypothetical protein